MAENKSQQKCGTKRDVENKVVMVTGASSGLGKEFCVDLAKAGCKIIAAARRIDRLQSLCDSINASSSGGVRAVAVELDVSNGGKAIDECVGKAWEAFGCIHALVNNAGIRGNVRSPLDITEEEWDATITTNLTGAWLVSKSVCIRMRDAKIGGSIINISSLAGLNRSQLRGSVAYSASKAGLNSLTRMMALELGVYNIRVNAIAPGLFKSEITENLVKKDRINNIARRTVPLQTFGTTDPALTSLIRHLILDSSEYVTGNIFIADAGLILPGVPIFSSL